MALAVSCSAHSPGGGGGPSSSSNVDCTTLCARLDGADNCASTAVSECNTSCTSLIARGGTRCTAELDALAACATTAPVRCVGTGLNPFTGCNAPFITAATCANRSPQDAGP